MWRIFVCDGNEAERKQIIEFVRRCCDENSVEARTSGCSDWPELAELVTTAEPDIVIIAKDGVEGLDTITCACYLTGRIIWFSNLDFGIQAYRLCVAYFCKKPVTYQKIVRAVKRCLEKQTKSPGDIS